VTCKAVQKSNLEKEWLVASFAKNADMKVPSGLANVHPAVLGTASKKAL
jgi:hypothetical protein